MSAHALLLTMLLGSIIATPVLADDGEAGDKKGQAVKSAPKKDRDGFRELFDGKSLKGWKNNENPESFRVEEGAIVSNGPRSHLFYVGDEKPFVNFELKAEIKTEANSNAGLYFHTKYQAKGWPKHGFEVQINNSYKRDWRRTASLYGVQDIREAPAKDGEWFTMHIIVKGREVEIRVDGKKVNTWKEPEGHKAGKDFTRKLDRGTFAIQAHDPGSKVHVRSVKVKRLP